MYFTGSYTLLHLLKAAAVTSACVRYGRCAGRQTIATGPGATASSEYRAARKPRGNGEERNPFEEQ